MQGIRLDAIVTHALRIEIWYFQDKTRDEVDDYDSKSTRKEQAMPCYKVCTTIMSIICREICLQHRK